MEQSNSLDAFALDDFDSSSGSATSILRTIAGLYLRHEVEPIERARVVDLVSTAGISSPRAQTSISRLIERGVLESVGTARLQVTAPARKMFARGNRRIFTPRQMTASDQWTIITYSIPETMRATRHQLRKHFAQLGGGSVAPGVWIFPAYLHDEVLQIVQALKTRGYTTIFTALTPEFSGTPQESAEQWWNLRRLSSIHEDFLGAVSTLTPKPKNPAFAYLGYVKLIDAWRAIPYLDPGLPDFMLPNDWLGSQSRERFIQLSGTYKAEAQKFASSLLQQES